VGCYGQADKQMKIILDTDIGSDIDDAVCLAYLLAQPQCELLGITTVTGEAVKRAQLASVLCKVAGKDIPIFPGSEEPLIRPEQIQKYATQAIALSKWPFQQDFPKGQAIEFLRQTIRVNPGEVTLLTIGPLTNIGLLFKTDPEIAHLLKSIVLMCGKFGNQLPGLGPLEWNAMGDPHATEIVYNAPVPIHRSVGLDVTCQVTMPKEEVQRRFNCELLRPVLDFAEVWFKEVSGITFHDPLAAVSIFDNQILEFSRGKVDIELTSERLWGYTFFTPQLDGVHEVAFKVATERFFSAYFQNFN
jgi:purine nucleosidase